MPTDKTELVIAMAQVVGGPDIDVNLDAIARLVAEAAAAGAKLVAFPEAVMFDYTVSAEKMAAVARSDAKRFKARLRELAMKHDIAVVAGIYDEGEGHLATNSLVAWDGQGAELGRYEKLHLYDAFGYCESDKNQKAPLQPDFGELTLFDLGGLRFGLMNCYDTRFPELARLLAERGADVIVVSSGWCSGPLKEFHWQTLLQARAIENTCFVAASCQPPPLSVGHTMIIDPSGLPISMVPSAEGLAIARVSRARLHAVREILPLLKHRRYAIVQKA